MPNKGTKTTPSSNGKTEAGAGGNSILTQVSETKFLKANLSSAVPKATASKSSDPYSPPSKYSSKKHIEEAKLNTTKSQSSLISQHSVSDDVIASPANGMYVDPDAKYYFDVSTYNKTVDSLIIHLNIEEHHYYITRDQLLSLPESLLLCLFPNGVFMNRQGEVINSLTEEDEVYVFNFSCECFEYIMDVYSSATFDLINFPLSKLYEMYGDPVAVQAALAAGQSNNHSSGGFFSHLAHHALNSSASSIPSTGDSGENTYLQKNPSIIVLREDLDYYCIPLNIKIEPSTHEVLDVFMRSVKLAAGSYLSEQQSIFDGLYCSNKVELNSETGEKKLGVAEQHLMDMLCSSGLPRNSIWGNRAQEMDKTVISSLSLIRLTNETTEIYRNLVSESYEKNLKDDKVKIEQLKEQQQQQQQQQAQLTPQTSRTMDDNDRLTTTVSSQSIHNNISGSSTDLTPTTSRKSRWSKLGNVKSRSRSRHDSKQRPENTIAQQIKQVGPQSRHLYDYAPKPEINSKLLLFWKKPARKCWWGATECNLELELPFDMEVFEDPTDKNVTVFKIKNTGYSKIVLPVRLHIRRVWTLEVSIVGV